MANVVREDQEKLTTILTVNLQKEDYNEKVQNELKKLRKKVSIKGFRTGMTPMSYIYKLYGNKVLVEEINNVLNEELNRYLRDNSVHILGQPLPLADEMPDIDVKNPKDLAFKYELGLAPDFEIAGLTEDSNVEMHDVTVDDEIIDKEILRMRKQAGEKTNPEDIKDEDVVNVDLAELDGEKLKEDGYKISTTISVDLINSKDLKQRILKLKKGDNFNLNILEVEDKEPDEIRKQVLGLAENDPVPGDEFQATITEIHRQELAEVNQDFFDKVFGPGGVKDEEEFRNKLKENIKKYYDSHADGFLYKEIKDHLMEKNPLDLPDDFLKRWMEATNEEITAENIESDYEGFSENLKWTLITNQIAEKNDLGVSQEELRAGFEENVRSYFGGQANNDTLKQFTDHMMKNEESVRKKHDELLSEKIFQFMKGKVKIVKKPIPWKKFDELLKK